MKEKDIEKINEFRTKRIKQLLSDEALITLPNNGKIILHLVPLKSFEFGYKVDMDPIIKDRSLMRPIYCSGPNRRINFDGILTYGGNDVKKTTSYVQLYRNGVIESLNGFILRPREGEPKIIFSKTIEDELIKSLSEYLTILQKLQVDMPILLSLVITGIEGFKMGADSRSFSYDDYEIDKDILEFPWVIIESYEETPEDILKSSFDLFWNACGFDRSLNYDKDGKRIKK